MDQRYRVESLEDTVVFPKPSGDFEAKAVSVPKIVSDKQRHERKRIFVSSVACFLLIFGLSFGVFKLLSNNKPNVISTATTETTPLYKEGKMKTYNFNVYAKEWDDNQYKFSNAHYYEKYLINYHLLDFKDTKITKDSSKNMYWSLYIGKDLKQKDMHRLEIKVINGYLFVFSSMSNEVGNNLVVYDADGKEYYNLKEEVEKYEEIDLNPDGIRTWTTDFNVDRLSFRVYTKVGSKPTTCENSDNMIIYLDFAINFIDNKFSPFEWLSTVKTNTICNREDSADELIKTIE